ncbi:MAG TPA: agmatine deiminase family protein [Gammaproteobacteria bacterium]|jgi:agmatine deiminase|nr:agmatine deiminase [Gammaproteobacteria bacterium]HJM08944.1 agmatine deiminase family protein [Gammaproteobacteria bacterium]HJN00057.1 agmatine deiminase family protein [Gammaproteobacteria bacterium]
MNEFKKYPKDLGFWMPAEWEVHQQCWMMWPTGLDLDRYPDTSRMRMGYAAAANAISRFENITIIANDSDTEECKNLIDQSVGLYNLQIDDSWCRDTGPTFITDGKNLGGVDWEFNNYGELLGPDFLNDQNVAKQVINLTSAKYFDAPIILEGGGIHTDGKGTLMITEDVLLDTNRNPGLNKKDAEKILSNYLGVNNFIWLIAALEYDDTGGHIDNLACFAPGGIIIALNEDNPEDSNHERLKENLSRLKNAKDIKRKAYEIVKIDQPSYDSFLGKRLPMSYINFYIANNGIVMPVFNDAKDDDAIEKIQNVFKNKRVVTVPGRPIVEGGGCVHCITQQQPLIT